MSASAPGSSSRKGRGWRLGYGVFCLLYAAWVVYLGLDNFDKVYGEYQLVQEQQLDSRTEEIALQELVDQCRRAARRNGRSRPGGISEEACRSFPPAALAEQRTRVVARLLAEEKLFQRKLVVFALTFAVFFIALPLVFLYLLLSFLVWVFRDMKFVK